MAGLKAKLYVTEAGIILADEGGNVLRVAKYAGDPYRQYRLVSTGNRIEELDELLRWAADARVSDLEVHVPGVDVLADSLGIRPWQVEGPSLDDRIRLMTRASLTASEDDAVNLIRDFAVRMSEDRIREEGARLDLHATQLVSSIDELDKVINTLAARVREWYGLHFPELDGILQDPHIYVRLVSILGRRDNFRAVRLVELGIPESRARIIEEAGAKSKGADIREEELALLQGLAANTYNLHQLRQRLTAALEDVMSEIAPNVTNIVGATIGARLLARAGGLAGLTRMPASTIQVLGAEKALFRALKYGSRPPKHGIIFQHPLIHGAQKWQRGKIARAMAAKLAIAARMDYYSGVLDPSLKEKLDERVEEVKRKYAKPPMREKERERPGRRVKGRRKEREERRR